MGKNLFVCKQLIKKYAKLKPMRFFLLSVQYQCRFTRLLFKFSVKPACALSHKRARTRRNMFDAAIAEYDENGKSDTYASLSCSTADKRLPQLIKTSRLPSGLSAGSGLITP